MLSARVAAARSTRNAAEDENSQVYKLSAAYAKLLLVSSGDILEYVEEDEDSEGGVSR